MKNFLVVHKGILIGLLLLLAGCASKLSGPQGRLQGQLPSSAQQYLSLAANSQGVTQQQYQLLAAEQFLLENNPTQAQAILDQVSTAGLPASLNNQVNLLEAGLALVNNQPKQGLSSLRQVNAVQLPAELQTAYLSTAANIYLRNNDLADSLIMQINLNSQLPSQTQIVAQQQIWLNLQKLSLNTLQQLANQNRIRLVQGWLQLAIIAEQNANSTANLVAAIRNWQQTFPNHPANSFIDDSRLTTASAPPEPDQIALLLPLQGDFADAGKAVRDGFMTAYYMNVKNVANPPTIKVYDTSTVSDIRQLYQQAVQSGAQLVVGPLTKDKLSQLTGSSLSVPTLALNYLPEDSSSVNNLVQFGLSPQQAANEAADEAWQNGSSKILIIASAGDWSTEIQQAFATRWQTLGGQIVDSVTVMAGPTLQSSIANALQAEQDQQKVKALQQELGNRFNYSALRRQDIDGIFLIATPEQARQIIPLLKFYYAGNIPVYATSVIYAGFPQPSQDLDLDGAFFVDMPWILTSNEYIARLQQSIAALWNNNYLSYSRMYALGADSFLLAMQLTRLSALPTFGLEGVSGRLYLLPNQQIYRQLLKAQMLNGTPQLIN